MFQFQLHQESHNAVLIHMQAGKVVHSFMPEREAAHRLDQIGKEGGFGRMVAADPFFEMEDLVAISPSTRNQVAIAEEQLRRHVLCMQIMDRNRVATNPEARAKVAKTVQHLVDLTVARAHSRH